MLYPMETGKRGFSSAAKEEIITLKSLTVLLSDVARPDRISGADINAICQEVKLLPLTMYPAHPAGSVYMLLMNCWGDTGVG